MASSIRALSNHYETLQVAPDATSREIVEAFASHMRAARVRPDMTVARLAQLSVAYEILRDPVKRRAYDASIGLRQEPATASTNASSFLGTPVVYRLNRFAEPSPNPASHQKAPPAAKTPAEPRIAAFIASSLREPAEKVERSAPSPQAESPPLQQAADPPSPVDESPESGRGRMPIGRTGATLAAGVIGVAVLAVAGTLPQRNPDRLATKATREEPGVTVPLPPVAAPRDSFVVAKAPATTAATTEDSAPRLTTTAEHGASARKSRPAPLLALNTEQAPPTSDGAGEVQSQPSEITAQKPPEADPAVEAPAAAAESASVTAAAVKMPLPNATIARTIERIGYGCGRVVSTSDVEGNGGVFNITCSSGDTYRASPIRGRYHFRRLSSH